MKRSLHMTSFHIAGAFIGTIVGAGFATGQEVFQFFTLFSWKGITGIAMATVLFCYLGVALMLISRKIQANSHLDLVKVLAGGRLAVFIDWFISISFLGVLIVMAAGGGAVAKEQFALPPLAGSVLIISLTFITVISGIHHVIRAISLVVPFLLCAVFSVALYSILSFSITPEKITFLQELPIKAAPHWTFSSLLYVSYNMLLAVAILAPLGVAASDRSSVIKGGILGGLGLGLGILAIHLAMVSGIPDIVYYEVPMIYLAVQFSPLFAWCYGFILLLEIYTTAVSVLYGFAARFARLPKMRSLWAGIACFGAIIFAQIGFSKVIVTVYPLIGYIGLIFIILIIKSGLFDGGFRK